MPYPTGPMDKVDISQIPPISADETGFAAFFESFETLQDGDEKLKAASSVFKNAVLPERKSPLGLKFSYQVHLLTALQKTKSEIETLLQKMEAKGEEAPISTPAFYPGEKELKPFKEGEKPALPEKRERFTFLAETSGKKALQIFSKGQTQESKMSSLPSKEKEFPVEPNPYPTKTMQPESSKNFGKQKLLHLALEQLVGALEIKILEKNSPTAILQKIQPLLDHLIFVVKTEDNMARPSPKLIQLVRSLGEAFSTVRQLSWDAFFKPGVERLLEPGTPQKRPVSEKAAYPPERSSLEKEKFPLSLAPSAPNKPVTAPVPISPTALSRLLPEKNEAEMKGQLHRETSPWAAPYSAVSKLESRLRLKLKKREKTPRKRKEKEELENLFE